MFLVDTCIFIDFFRGKKDRRFIHMVNEGEVSLSSIVKLELIQGARAQEVPSLKRVLSGFPELVIDETIVQIAEEIVMKIKPKGFTVGVPDLLIAAQSVRFKQKVYTHDQLLLKILSKL